MLPYPSKIFGNRPVCGKNRYEHSFLGIFNACPIALERHSENNKSESPGAAYNVTSLGEVYRFVDRGSGWPETWM